MNTERELAEVQTVTHMEHGDRLPYPYPMAGCKYTPEECAKILAGRINQPHYVAHIVRRAIEHALLSRADGGEDSVPHGFTIELPYKHKTINGQMYYAVPDILGLGGYSYGESRTGMFRITLEDEAMAKERGE